jgi:putative transposase
MGRRSTHTLEQIIGKLRQVEVMLSQGIAIGEASRKIGVTAHTYYRWRKEYGGAESHLTSGMLPPK